MAARLSPTAVADLRARMGPVGIWTAGLDGLPATAVGAAAAQLEAHGAGALFFGESYGREAFSQAALLLAGTDRMLIGTGIASIHGRDATASRGAQATLAAAHDDRFILGLGVSHRPLVERFRKGDYGSPLIAMASYLDALDEVNLLVPDAGSAGPRLVAALGPRMLELSAAKADGAHPYKTLPSHTAEAREVIGPDKLLVVEQAVTLVADAEEHRRRAKVHLEVYTGLPNYRRSWERQGFDTDDFVRGGSTRLQDALVAHGPDAAVAAVRAHLDAGADHVLLQVIGEHPLDPAVADACVLLDITVQAART